VPLGEIGQVNELQVGALSSMSARAPQRHLPHRQGSRAASSPENKFQVNYVKVVTEPSVVYLLGQWSPATEAA